MKKEIIEEKKDIILNARDITKVFVTPTLKTEVLKGVNFSVEKGEFVAIVGESGSGKSTLLYILGGLDTPTSGEVDLLRKRIDKISDNEMAKMRRQNFSFVYQFDNLVPNLTAYENIVLPLLLDKKNTKDFDSSVMELAKFLGIDNRLKNYPRELSGGEQQRVAIARALATNPEIIFLDEPTGSLDKQRGIDVMEMLIDINIQKSVALVMVTHSLAHSKYASRVVRMEDGVIIPNIEEF